MMRLIASERVAGLCMIPRIAEVIVYRLVSSGTIEEKVMELKARKAALFASVLDGGDGGTGAGTPLDAADIRELLRD